MKSKNRDNKDAQNSACGIKSGNVVTRNRVISLKFIKRDYSYS